MIFIEIDKKRYQFEGTCQFRQIDVSDKSIMEVHTKALLDALFPAFHASGLRGQAIVAIGLGSLGVLLLVLGAVRVGHTMRAAQRE